jgi:hypothetical protein
MAGWVNPESGVWDDNYHSQMEAKERGSGGGGGGGGGGGQSVADMAKELIKLYQESNKPAIESLQASIPEIGAKYAQTGDYLKKQVGTLDERYKNLLADIKGQGEQVLKRNEINTSQELGRRGISAEGGLFGKTINDVLDPINKYYAGQYKDVGLSNQSALDSLLNQISGLTTSQVEEERAVQNAIAQLKAGSSSAIPNAISLYTAQNTQNNAANTYALANKEYELKYQQFKQNPGGTLG